MRVRANTRKRSHLTLCSNMRAVHNTVGFNQTVIGYMAITNQYVWPDFYPVTQSYLTFKNGVDINKAIPAGGQVTANINAIRIREADPVGHLVFSQLALMAPFQYGELAAAVDATYL